MTEGQPQLTNINTAPRFVEPKVHPDIARYFRDKIQQASASKDYNDTLRVQGRLLDVKHNLYTLADLRQKGETKAADELAKFWDLTEADEAKYMTDEEPEVIRLQDLWSTTANGDLSGLHSEIENDILTINTQLEVANDHFPSGIDHFDNDKRKYDTTVAELAEWQAGLQEAPV